jgi:fucose 4-O-acetylase-like acetyltransferase
MIKNNRVVHVDIAKGISIILVALFHSDLSNFAPDTVVAMGLFRMPLFFFLSGLFFSPSLGTKDFLWKKSDELLKPYFVTFAALLVFLFLAGRAGDVMHRLKGILYGNGGTIAWGASTQWAPMWFLTHLFAIYCFAFLIFRFTDIQKRNLTAKIVFIVAMLAIGSHWINAFWNVKITLFDNNIVLPGLPFSCDLLFISAAFFISGTFLKERIINFVPNSYAFFISILVFIAVVVMTSAKVDLSRRVYINPLFATIGAICGIYFVLCFSVYSSKLILLQNALLKLGQASLFILIFHVCIGSLVFRIIGQFGLNRPVVLLFSLIAFFSSITLPVLIKAIVSRSELLSLFYFPLKSNNLLCRINRV